jgi:hypothetical protein
MKANKGWHEECKGNLKKASLKSKTKKKEV